mmetsp:Transcript_7455/g.12603  ORF Transcript_7455/g.12603 Transcript_7455/m.12603 type:complete len:329 (+) Transcript_7455:1010-1996(+)
MNRGCHILDLLLGPVNKGALSSPRGVVKELRLGDRVALGSNEDTALLALGAQGPDGRVATQLLPVGEPLLLDRVVEEVEELLGVADALGVGAVHELVGEGLDELLERLDLGVDFGLDLLAHLLLELEDLGLDEGDELTGLEVDVGAGVVADADEAVVVDGDLGVEVAVLLNEHVLLLLGDLELLDEPALGLGDLGGREAAQDGEAHILEELVDVLADVHAALDAHGDETGDAGADVVDVEDVDPRVQAEEVPVELERVVEDGEGQHAQDEDPDAVVLSLLLLLPLLPQENLGVVGWRLILGLHHCEAARRHALGFHFPHVLDIHTLVG